MPRKQKRRLVCAFSRHESPKRTRYPCQNYRAISTKRISSSSVFCVHLRSDTDRTDFSARAHPRGRVHTHTHTHTHTSTHKQRHTHTRERTCAFFVRGTPVTFPRIKTFRQNVDVGVGSREIRSTRNNDLIRHFSGTSVYRSFANQCPISKFPCLGR